ncbi:hypothetical protein HanPSC8_Chr17g0790931 [Helianthus annuus]|nr:hypothetical protein HanPSC8_Chr17g0790931 [Helianthus annuus]
MFSQVIVIVFNTFAFPIIYFRNGISRFHHSQIENLMVVRFVSIQAGTNSGSTQLYSSGFCFQHKQDIKRFYIMQG